MARTTIDLDLSVLNELRSLSKAQHKSLGRLISELVVVALEKHDQPPSRPEFHWHSQPMGALVDLEDKEAVAALSDRYP